MKKINLVKTKKRDIDLPLFHRHTPQTIKTTLFGCGGIVAFSFHFLFLCVYLTSCSSKQQAMNATFFKIYYLLLSALLFQHTTSTAPNTATDSNDTPRTRGVLYLDKWTFDKVVTGRYPSIIKFDAPASNSKNSTQLADDTWLDLIRAHYTIKGITFGRVLYHPLGEALRNRFHLNDTNLPAFILFPKQKYNFYEDYVQTKHQKLQMYNKDMVVGNYTTDSLGNFIRKYTRSSWIGQVGCLEHFDYMAMQLRTKQMNSDIIIEQAHYEMKNNVELVDVKYAQYYIEVFQRYSTQPGFLPREVSKLKRKQASDPGGYKHITYTEQLNILNCFVGGKVVEPKNEWQIKREEQQDKYFMRTGRMLVGFYPEL
jgi:hypothetical protein